MAKFHINQKGEVKQCRARKGNCPFGDEGDHFDSEQSAFAAIEKEMANFEELKNKYKDYPGIALIYEGEDPIKDRKTLKKIYNQDTIKRFTEFYETPPKTQKEFDRLEEKYGRLEKSPVLLVTVNKLINEGGKYDKVSH